MSVDFTAYVAVTEDDIKSGRVPNIDWDAIPTVNVSNLNAGLIMRNLGFTTDEIQSMFEFGMSITPLDIQSRILLCKLVPGLIQTRIAEQDGNMYTFGADAQYIDDKLTNIYALSEWCDSHGYNVSIH